jgi:uncharacterized protein YcfL
MKVIFVLAAFLLSFSLLFLRSNSYSTAKIHNDVIVSITSENHALIAIDYKHDRILSITNNSRKTIHIERIHSLSNPDLNIIGHENENSFTIRPGEEREFEFTQESKVLSGKVIEITVQWDEGRAKIKSTIPKEMD